MGLMIAGGAGLAIYAGMTDHAAGSLDDEGSVDGEWVQLADGRRLAFREYGPHKSGPVVFWYHDVGSSRLEPRSLGLEPALAAGTIRLIAIDRPGYGQSDAALRPGCDPLLAPSLDTEELAGLLHVSRYSVVCANSSGSYGLAAAATAAPDGPLYHVCLIGCDAPWDALDASVEALRPSGTKLAHRLARWGPPGDLALTVLFKSIQYQLFRSAESYVRGLTTQTASEEDRERLRRWTLRIGADEMVLAAREGMRKSVRGAVADVRALVGRPWPFSGSALPGRLRFWHGEQDSVVPLQVIEALVRSTHRAEPICVEAGAGRLSTLLLHSMDAILVAADSLPNSPYHRDPSFHSLMNLPPPPL